MSSPTAVSLADLDLPDAVSGLTLAAFVRDVCGRSPQAEAVVYGEVRLTYADLEALIRQVAKGLLAAGVVRGTPVAALLTNRPEWIATAFAAGMIGAVFVPINTFAAADERDHILRHSEAALLILQPTPSGRRHLDELLERHPEIAEAPPMLPRGFRHLRRVVCVGEKVAGIGDWDELLAGGADVPDAQLDDEIRLTEPGHEAVVIYTSGTTALPKAVLHVHQAPVIQFWRWSQISGVGPHDRVWSLQPFFWTAGFAWALGATLAAGACLVLDDVFDPHQALATIEREEVTTIQAAPNIEARLAQHAIEHPEHDLRLVRQLRVRSPLRKVLPDVPLPKNVGRYGATEAFTLVTSQAEHEIGAEGHGRPLPGMSVRILDFVSGLPVATGESGRIAFRGPTVMRSYYKVVAESCFDGHGYFLTEDVGSLDERGVLHFEGREAALVRTAGTNVSTLEIELALRTWGMLQTVAVVGVPHPTLGEAVVACAVRDSLHLEIDEAAVRQAARATLATYKVPRRVVFVEEENFPLTATGKGRIRDIERLVIESLRTDVDPEWRALLDG